MKILALPNALKGSLSARKAGQILERTLSAHHTVRVWPISDGGDGFLDFFQTLDPHAKRIFITAKNAFLKNKRTSFLLLSDRKTAIIETAKICGLGNANPSELNPLGASSYGIGQVLLAAARCGAKTIYVGLGGVATNDGGAGMAMACGAYLSNKKGHSLPLGAEALLKIACLDLQTLRKQFRGIKIIGICDVTNPLLGRLGSARVFGPQKGASPAQVIKLEHALKKWAQALKQETGRDIACLPSTGAAGAIAAGLCGCFGAELRLGASTLFKKARLQKQIQWADLIITCEGKLDEQTFYGKAPLAVLQLAYRAKKPVLFICGQLDKKVLSRRRLLPTQLAVLADFSPTPQDAKKHAARYMRRVCQHI